MKSSVSEKERVHIRLSFLFKYCRHVEMISANMGTGQV